MSNREDRCPCCGQTRLCPTLQEQIVELYRENGHTFSIARKLGLGIRVVLEAIKDEPPRSRQPRKPCAVIALEALALEAVLKRTPVKSRRPPLPLPEEPRARLRVLKKRLRQRQYNARVRITG